MKNDEPPLISFSSHKMQSSFLSFFYISFTARLFCFQEDSLSKVQIKLPLFPSLFPVPFSLHAASLYTCYRDYLRLFSSYPLSFPLCKLRGSTCADIRGGLARDDRSSGKTRLAPRAIAEQLCCTCEITLRETAPSPPPRGTPFINTARLAN